METEIIDSKTAAEILGMNLTELQRQIKAGNVPVPLNRDKAGRGVPFIHSRAAILEARARL